MDNIEYPCCFYCSFYNNPRNYCSHQTQYGNVPPDFDCDHFDRAEDFDYEEFEEEEFEEED